jgi:hypothetical protein
MTDHIAADTWTEALNVRDTEICQERLNRLLDKFGFFTAWCGDPTGAFFKFIIGFLDDEKQEADVGPRVVLALVPAFGADLESFVVSLLVILDEAFEADVASDVDADVIAGE